MANRVLKATDLTIDGNLVVTGTTASVESTNSTLKDNIIVLNQGETGAGVTLVNAGLEIDRGTEDNAQLVWDEVTDKWQLKVGTTVTGTLATTSGAGAGSWTGLSDTPATFTADKFIKVNAGGTALEFTDEPGLPAQSNHTGKILTTDGSMAYWDHERDPIFLTSPAALITGYDIQEWNIAVSQAFEAYGWGPCSDGSVAGGPCVNRRLPAQATHAGKILTTDGTDASWVDESTINTSHTKKALIYAIIFGG